MSSFGQKARAFWNHPAGPQTIHFWAPTFKWCISLANIADIQRPPEKISAPQQCAITVTGFIFARYGFQIIPLNYNLIAVNGFMGITGTYQLFRRFMYERSVKEAEASGTAAASTASTASTA
uniref:Mitochondrial pyruvate carrier n=1 Tax=Polytomella parva TaxID=51329 RepID=A0A7S0UT15_9CHLO|mmetsp:Transcript_20157/g.36219  ORF Transcript_20157/g.36219 Transcript_20157/m.36219 type:complete len:122 (+) Transcript_20157:113-478(+)|eukprot:CAMPEP_0175051348 /NCGR_PEP_ID=MMETSP0052_2-20121109/7746_1 /TAXON_ID=51329 ORGANISM="Polytomella parva, Strain SAG 63-3" /NCGR_SAMPLE_ID=MMETSP0052_2 /ASSEMBLY_ACC=CAM_ASM_000194 /LENGTH=121 /DNA_ID=CAMNT_0016315615 /DNA_START=123 /DNA_END=488 /DNA_ORIENTATION=-